MTNMVIFWSFGVSDICTVAMVDLALKGGGGGSARVMRSKNTAAPKLLDQVTKLTCDRRILRHVMTKDTQQTNCGSGKRLCDFVAEHFKIEVKNIDFVSSSTMDAIIMGSLALVECSKAKEPA
jgi:hypothetical protein